MNEKVEITKAAKAMAELNWAFLDVHENAEDAARWLDEFIPLYMRQSPEVRHQWARQELHNVRELWNDLRVHFPSLLEALENQYGVD